MPNPLTKLGSSALKRMNALRGPVSVMERFGCHWVLSKDNWIDARLMAYKPFEAEQIKRFIGYFAEHPVEVMFDVGANFGLYSMLAGVRGGVQEIHAFEPVGRNYNQLCANVFANQLDDYVSTYHMALSNQVGEAVMRVAPLSSGVSRLAEADDRAADAQFTKTETVTTARLDDLIPVSGQAIYAKIDVEGHELSVLDGARSVLANNHGALQIEAFGDAGGKAVAERVSALGYEHVGVIEHDHYFIKQAG